RRHPQDRPLDRPLQARDRELGRRAARSVLQRQHGGGHRRSRAACGAGWGLSKRDSHMIIVPDLKDKVALVTGGSRGIGAAIAVALAEAGAAVAINYRERADAANALAADINAAKGRAIAVAADVSKAADVEKMVEHVAAHLGPIDILVN